MTDKLTEMVEKLRESLVAIIASGQQRRLRPSQIAAEILADDVVAAALLEARVSPQAGEVSERAREIIAKHFEASLDEVTDLVDTDSPLWCAVLEALSTVPVRPE